MHYFGAPLEKGEKKRLCSQPNYRPDYHFSEGVGVNIPRTPTTDLITANYRFSEEGVLIPHSPTTELITANYCFSEEGVLLPGIPATDLITTDYCFSEG